MPLTRENKYYDFEELFFEKDCNIDNIIINFFLNIKILLKAILNISHIKLKK